MNDFTPPLAVLYSKSFRERQTFMELESKQKMMRSMFKVTFNLGIHITQRNDLLSKVLPSLSCLRRNASAAPKRFYKRTYVVCSDGQWEITLDQRKLKTPKGKQFVVHNEPLALAVAAEWDSQKEKIHQSTMHLFNLCSTAIDNPNNYTKFNLMQLIMSYLETDTILCFSQEKDELYDMQQREWRPIIQWFCEHFKVSVEPTQTLDGAVISEATKATISRHLMSYNMWAMYGFAFGVSSIKSLILSLCCTERHISVEKAVQLSRLEEEYQSGRWGRVEWAHDLSQMETQARLAAAILFIQLNTSSSVVQKKQ